METRRRDKRIFSLRFFALILAVIILAPCLALVGFNVAWAAPAVVYNAPAAGETNAYRNTLITVIFSEAMDAATINVDTFSITNLGTGTAVAGTVTYNPDTRSATFKPADFYSLEAGVDYQATISGTVANLASPVETMGSDHVWTFTTTADVDADPPNNEGNLSPTEDAEDVARDAEVRVWFDEDMDPSSFNSASFFLNGVSSTLKYNPYTRTASLIPDELLDYGSTYTVSLTNGLTDMADNPLGSGKTWSFTTTEYAPTDTTPPTVVSVTPVEDSTGVATSTTLTAVFSEPMNEASVLQSFMLSHAITGTVTYRSSDMTAVFTPDAELPQAVDYTATITTAAMDLAGNNLTAGKEWSFTTVGATDTEPPTVLSQTPPSDALNVPTDIQPFVIFSEPMDASTIDENSFFMKKSGQTEKISATVTYQSSNNMAVLTPTGLVALDDNATYTVTLSNTVADTAGLHPEEPLSWSFTTGPGSDSTPPKIASVSPKDEAEEVDLDTPITVTFDKDMDASSINSDTFGLNLGTSGAYTYNTETRTAVLQPDQPLQDDTTYKATVTTGVRDLAGNNLAGGMSWTFTTYQVPDVTPPEVAIINPVDGAVDVALNPTITATFNEAVDSASLDNQSFYLTYDSGKPVAASTTYSDANWTASLTPSQTLLQNTEYTAALTTQIMDETGNHLAQNVSWSFTTKADQTPPEISSVIPEDNADNVALDVKVKAVFDEDLDASTVTSSSFFLRQGQTQVSGAVTYDSGTKTAVFTPAAALEGDATYTASITTAVTDLAGNNMKSGRTWSFQTYAPPDETPPTVASTTPVNGAEGVSVDSAVYVVFSEEMKASTINASTFTLDNGVTGEISCSGTTAVFTPDAFLTQGQTYTATISTGVTDLAGNNLASNYSWSFTTIGDSTPPSVSDVFPIAGADGVALDSTIKVYFNEDIDQASLTSSSFFIKKGTASVAGTISYDQASYMATFTPASALDGGTGYTVSLTTAIKDKSGNNMTSGYSWSFTTVTPPDQTPPTVTATTPVNGAEGVLVDSAVYVVFSEEMKASTINASTFTLDNGVTGEISYSGTTAVFTPDASLTQGQTYTATISTGVTDLAGNSLASNYTWSFTTKPDTTPPQISQTSPSDAAENVALNTPVIVYFDESMDADSITTASFLLTKGGAQVQGAVTYDEAGRAAVFTPSAKLEGSTEYAALITTAVKDAAGNALASGYSWSFTTYAQADVEAPQVVAVTPVLDGVDVPLNVVVAAVFNEALSALTVNASTFTLENAGGSITGTVSYDADALTAQFTLAVNLDPETVYTAVLTTGITDLSENALESDYTWSFTTAQQDDQDPPTVQSTYPSAGATNVAIDAAISAVFSEELNQTTVNASTFLLLDSTGGGIDGAVAYNSSSHTAVFTPSAALANSSTYTARLTTSLTDLAGNQLAATYTWTFTTVAEGLTPPEVSSRYPVDGASSVPINSGVSVTFDQNMDASTISAQTFTLTPTGSQSPLSGQVEYSSLTRTAVLRPYSQLTVDAAFTASLSKDIKSAQGLSLASDITWELETGQDSDGDAPQVASVFPTSNATGVDLSTVVSVQFDEVIEQTSLTESALTLDHDASGTLTYNEDTNTLILTPDSSLSPLQTYTAELASDIKDMAGNQIQAGMQWSFTTGAGGSTTPSQVISVIPVKGAVASAETLLVVQFSKALNESSVSTDNFSISPAKVGQVSYTGKTLTFVPLGRFEYGLLYTVKVTGLTDLNGLTVPDYTWTFMTSQAPKSKEKEKGPLGCFIEVLDQ